MNQLWCPINPEEKYWGILVLEKYWGITVLKDIFAVGRSEKFFPQYCFCDYMLFKLANRHHITVQCFLHANAINEKVFCVLYFYLFFLMITSCLAWVCFAMEILKFALRCPGCSCRGMCSMKYHLGMNGFFICSFIVNTRGRHYIQSLIDTKLRRKFCANVTDLPIADNAVLPQFQRRRHVSLWNATEFHSVVIAWDFFQFCSDGKMGFEFRFMLIGRANQSEHTKISRTPLPFRQKSTKSDLYVV